MAEAEAAKPNAIVFDIETIADLTPATQDAVAALAEGREMTAEDYAGLCPPLARVACIAWMECQTQELHALCDGTLIGSPVPPALEIADGAGDQNPRLRCALQACVGEADLLRRFGQRVEAHAAAADARLVTYNGRGFDLPVLLHRGVKHAVADGRAPLLRAVRENRYAPRFHIDLMDVVTFGGATQRWPMAAYAIGLGFKSPKQDLDGSQVGPGVRAGRLLDVVRYCAGDVLATAHIYQRVVDLLPA